MVLYSNDLNCQSLFFLRSGSIFFKSIHLATVCGPAILVPFWRMIEDQPVRCCVKNPVNRPLNCIFLVLKWCTAATIQCYSSVSWVYIPMTGNINFRCYHLCCYHETPVSKVISCFFGLMTFRILSIRLGHHELSR